MGLTSLRTYGMDVPRESAKLVHIKEERNGNSTGEDQNRRMVQPNAKSKATEEKIPGKFELVEVTVPELKEVQVLVEVADCGDLPHRLWLLLRWGAHGLQADLDPGARIGW